MKSVIIGVVVASVLGWIASEVLTAQAIPASQAYATEGVRLSE